MNMQEIAVTVAELVATYFMPWPADPAPLGTKNFRTHEDVRAAAIDLAAGYQPEVIFERRRTGPLPSRQPTR